MTVTENELDASIPGIEISEQDYRTFVGSEADVYLGRWRSMENLDLRIRWHFTAGVFFVFWLLYRKMYLYSAILLVSVAVIVNGVALLVSRPVSMTMGIAAVIFMGLYGNQLYKVHATRKISAIYAATSDPEKRDQMLQEKGGTTMVPHMILILTILLSVIFNRLS